MAQTSSSSGKLLGPFLGHVTTSTVKVWLHLESDLKSVHVAAHPAGSKDVVAATAEIVIDPQRLWTGCVTLAGLTPNTRYQYSLWRDAARTEPLDLEDLESDDLHFWTLPADNADQVDFLVMSCHNPTKAKADGFDGHAVWVDIPQIMDKDSNGAVRMALLIGDQIYADDWQERLLKERDPEARLRIYLEVYRAFWSNIHYRRVMCSLPSVMMWDDHDIVDGWGSEEKSFVDESAEFKPEWRDLFSSASTAFSIMQASRNPEPLSPSSSDGFDCCFQVGQWGFVLMDLRTHRNARKGQVLDNTQWSRIQTWIESRRGNLKALFVVSPVVFSHGSPVIEDFLEDWWGSLMGLVDLVAEKFDWGKGLQSKFSDSLGDVRDDIRDSWSWSGNAASAEKVLDYLFKLQNDLAQPMNVILLSGDIHTPGYATVYSSALTQRKNTSIPHITSSAVAYAPFNWLLEAVYRNATRSVPLGTSGTFTSQVSHHFCSRGVAVLSLRRVMDQMQDSSSTPPEHYDLKVKYYLEGHAEPQVLLFDLSGASHRENITWSAQRKVSEPRYAPLENKSTRGEFDAKVQEAARTASLDAELDQRASQHPAGPTNWRKSIVDLMKVLGMDSSLGARKRLAQEWGFEGPFDGSARMNLFLKAQLRQRLDEAARRAD